jgi:hypothetical protein
MDEEALMDVAKDWPEVSFQTLQMNDFPMPVKNYRQYSLPVETSYGSAFIYKNKRIAQRYKRGEL